MGHIDVPKITDRRLTTWLGYSLEEIDPVTGQPKNKLIAQRLVDAALDAKTPLNIFIIIYGIISDRREGKPLQTNLNADITTSPFEGIPTEKLEALKAKLAEINKPEQAEGKCEKP